MADVKVPKLLHKMSLASQKAWYKKQGMEMPSATKPAEGEGKSAAAAKKVRVAPRKAVEIKPGSIRAINQARQDAYKGRQPIGATGSGGHSVMAGSNMSTAKGIIAGIKAGYNPRVSLNPYEGLTAKEKKAMKSEEVEQVDEGSKRMSAAVKLQRAFDREKAASDASRKRGEEVLAQARAEYAKKQAAKTNEEVEQVDEGSKAETEKVQVSTAEAEKVLGGPVSKRPKMPPGKQPAGYRYVRGLARRAMKAGMKKEEVEQVDEIVAETNYRRPSMREIDDALDAERKGNPEPANKLRDIMRARKSAQAQSATRPAQKFPVYEPGRRYVGDSVELDGPVIDEANSRNKEDTEMKYIEEKLTAADPASKWISDFVQSENPRFEGKSKKERINMALGAYYAAKGGKNEEVEQVDEFVDRETRLAARKAETGSSTRVSSGDVLGRRGGHETPKQAIARRVGKDSYGIKSGGKTSIYNRLPKPNLPEEAEQVDEVTGYEGVKDRTDMIKRAVAMNRMGKGVFLSRVKARAAEMKKEKARKKLAKEEAEGKTPTTDTEVSLARMHGNPKKITYGDVVKARIASAKKKVLNKD